MIWRKSSFSAGDPNCVELAHLATGIAVRDSKDPDGPVLTFAQLPSGPPSIVIATKIMQAPKAE
ncbi:DUF397 domain-containing protein [Actinophytocola sp.]|uniref:DUF397 domain-containing protein n=1 Tax=Actinophytocola sp. TaxID=1872138 RepID=UPI002ED635F4